MTREEVYRQQLTRLGVYDPAFEPEIKTLAKLERKQQRAEKAWSATAPPGGKPSFLDPHYQVIMQLEDKIFAHREALGLTPKSLRRLRGAPASDAPTPESEISARLDRLLDRAGSYDVPGEFKINTPGGVADG